MKPDEYGDTGSALTNGIEIRVQDDNGTLTDFTNGIKIKTNSHWGIICYDVDIKDWGTGGSNDLLLARWTFEKFGAHHHGGKMGIELKGSNNERLEFILNDDFSGLIAHYFVVQGININKVSG